MSENLYALVLAGGRGARFWPLSRRSRPKQCVSLGGGPAALVSTIERLAPLIPRERILIATGREMEAAVRELLPDVPSENFIVEPWGRNTAPCIGLGAVEIGRRSPDAVMAVFPSDHQVDDGEALRSVVAGAADAAKATNAFVTIGVEPTRPETGFGYVEIGPKMGEWGGHAFLKVSRFREKPSIDLAKEFVESGHHLWNAGMFVFTVGALKDGLRRFLPRTSEALERVTQNPDVLEDEWGNMDATSIDYGVMERSNAILTVRCDFGWRDLGTWTAAGETMPRQPGGRGVAGQIIAKDASGCVVYAPGKAVALVGIEDVVVVDTEDALLVMQGDRSASVGEIVRELEAQGRDGLT